MNRSLPPTGVGKIKDWHDPHNEACHHNQEGGVGVDCTCKRKVTRKPYRVVRVTDPEAQRAHNVTIEIHPNGLAVLRKKGCRRRYSVTLGVLYERLELNEAMRMARERKNARKQRRTR